MLCAWRARELPRLVEPLRAAAAGITGAYERQAPALGRYRAGSTTVTT
ncbi:hypothetical protein GCM10009850_119500 [Nonomuraea monospora]|uniref:Uncharacterized protein n=1 Tax=Nonomuraea monospora TaxID=568818 RepID=A0ABN3D3R1_9ACTN